MTGPDEIWIDERVLRTMNTEPDGEANNQGVRQCRYISHDRVAEMVRGAQGGPEFFIQLQIEAGGIMFALTNYGRIFRQSVGAPAWEIVAVPDFDEAPAP